MLLHSHLKNSWASSSFPRSKPLPILCKLESTPMGDKGDFPCLAFITRLSNSHVKHHSFFRPRKKSQKKINLQTNEEEKRTETATENIKRGKEVTCFRMKSFQEISCKWSSKCQALEHSICIATGGNFKKNAKQSQSSNFIIKK